MSDLSARLSLPYLLPAQAQKHVTHNEALQRLDVLVQLVVEAFDAETPPGSAGEGQVWALGAAPSGAWVGQGGALAAFLGGGWQFIVPQEGWQAVEAGSGILRLRRGSAWVFPQIGTLPGLGINTDYDSENRLAVASNSALFTHIGASHRLKINKAETAETASVLFQNDWSGRAEFGLTGDDDFRLKVSADGALWQEALRIDAASGGLYHGAHQLLDRGAVLGTASVVAGLPAGALIEQGSSAAGRYLRLTDGTQICWHQLVLGSPAAAGAGTFADPYRSNSLDWTYPKAFAAAPVISGRVWVDSANAAERMLTLTSRAASATALAAVQAVRGSGHAGTTSCTADLMAVGRWI